MNNKFIRYAVVEPKWWVRIAVMVALIATIVVQNWYRNVQAKQISDAQKKVDLVAMIPAMEKELKTKAQLEAFRNEGNEQDAQARFSKISGIAMQGDRPSVLIDDTVYGEGDTFGEFVIIKITEEMITLENKKTNAIKHLYVFE